MRIQNNVMAMNTHRSYTINNDNVAKSAEKLSSGYRINRAGDDAAGLAISEKMRSQIRGLNMATKNSQDAISLVQTAEGALQETHNILQRMRELSVQSASDTNETSVDRDALNKEFQQLISEIDDTASKTKFNDMGLIDGSFASKTMSIKAADLAALPAGVSVSVANAMAGDQSVTAVNVPEVIGTNTAATAPTVTTTAAKGVTFTAINALGNSINGVTSGAAQVTFNDNTNEISITLSVNGKSYTSAPVVKSTAAAADTIDFNFEGLGKLTYEFQAAATSFANVKTELGNVAGQTLTFNAGANAVSTPAQEAMIKLTSGGEDVYVKAGDTHAKFSSGVVLSFDKVGVVGTTTGPFAASMDLNVVENQGKPLTIQTGANQYDELRITIDRMDSEKLGVKFSDISTRTNASKAITEVNGAVNQVSTQRAALGALQNRLNHKIANLKVSSENLQAAESRIRDVDIASEMTTFTKNNILSQASTAMLAQANAAPQNVLSLLR